jgi:hypothetical protein
MEPVDRFSSLELARNAAISWLEARGVVFGTYRRVEVGRLGVLTGHEVGVSGTEKPFWRLRLDYDTVKGPHFNAEDGENAARAKRAFAFPGTEQVIVQLAKGLRPR